MARGRVIRFCPIPPCTHLARSGSRFHCLGGVAKTLSPEPMENAILAHVYATSLRSSTRRDRYAISSYSRSDQATAERKCGGELEHKRSCPSLPGVEHLLGLPYERHSLVRVLR